MARYRSLDTQVIHAGTPTPRPGGAVVFPIFQSANFEHADEATYEAVRYARLSNTPNHQMLADRLATIEGTESALVTASGMAAISATLLSTLSAGDHLLMQSTVYGGTHSLMTQDARRLGIETTFVDGSDPDTWAQAITPRTRAIYVESVSNPLMEVPALDVVPTFARRHGLTSIIDNTFLSPVNLRPAALGFDVVIHSATKYLNGHSDITAGVIAGSRLLVQQCHQALNHFGGSLDPHACFLLERGLRTLALRVGRQNQTALQIAQVLASHPSITRVRYPGLPSHPAHEIATRYLDGFGGMLSFETRTPAIAEQFLEAVEIPVHAASLGGVETLAVRPSRSTHLGMAPEEREALGITDSLVRLSVGIEDPHELQDDLLRALNPGSPAHDVMG